MYNVSARENEKYIREKVIDEDLYNQLAEEASELAQAANKMVRVLRGTNPTPKSFDDVAKDLTEEFSDLVLVAKILDIHVDWLVSEYKLYRWRKRLEENGGNQNGRQEA